MKKLLPCRLLTTLLLFVAFFATSSLSAQQSCLRSSTLDPITHELTRFTCVNHDVIIQTVTFNGTTGEPIQWIIFGDATGGAYFTNSPNVDKKAPVDAVLAPTNPVNLESVNEIRVTMGPNAGSVEIRMIYKNNPIATACTSSGPAVRLTVEGTSTPRVCPTDLSTITVTPGSFGTVLVENSAPIVFGPYEFTLLKDGVTVVRPDNPNATGSWGGLGAGNYQIRITGPIVDCPDLSNVIVVNSIVDSPLIANCPTPVDRPACANQTDLEGIFQAWLATFSHTTGFPPVITVTDPDGVIVPLKAPNHCGGTVTVTWKVTDKCNQTDTCTSTFLVRPSVAPVIICAPGGDLGCNPQSIPEPVAPRVDSACPTLPYTYKDVVTGPMCARVLTRTYTVTNECQQTSTCDQVFTYREDHVAPTLHNVPAGGDLGCNPKNLPACDPLVTAKDNCDEFPVAHCSAGTITNTGCNYRQVFTYSAMDSCGNPVSQEVTYTWKVDTTAPVVTCPKDRILACNAPTPTPEVATAEDNCDGSLPTTASVGTIEVDGCNRRLVITYSATDACGNTGSCQQVNTWTVNLVVPVIVLDLAPTLGNDPTPEQIEAALGTAHIDSPCGAHLFVSTGNVTETSPCHWSQTRTWTGNDDCDHKAVAVDRTVTWTTSGCNPANGCTLGYWKNHTKAWDCYQTCTLYKDVFSGSTLPAGLTLQQALNLGGGGCNNLARQSVAALLSICDGTLNYSVATIADLQALVNAAFAEGKCGALGSTLDGYNNAGGANHCNVAKSPNTTVSTCVVLKKGVNATGKVAPSDSTIFKVYPNPFTNSFNINSSNTVNPVSISIFDVLGRSVETRTVNPAEFDFTSFGTNFPTGIYNVIFNQATEQKSLRVIKQ